MTETVTIHGQGLTVEHTGTEPDPKRRRPPAIPKARHDGRAKTGRTLDEVRTQPNPYWTDEENHAAETSAP